MKDRMNPWAGLASYQDGDARQFCGRDNESYDVATLVDNNIFVTLYGKSGIGKSSLLNAGVFPRLRKMGYLPVAVRLGIEAEGVSLQSCILKKLDAAVASVGSFRSCEIVSMPEDDQEETWLWSHFARSRFEDSAGLVLFPVLVFDQFEEVFRSRPREAGTLLRQIHYMMDESHAIPATKDYSYDFNFRFIVSIREDELYRLEDSLDGNYLPDMKKCRYRLRELSSKGVRDVILIPGGPFIAKGEEDAVVESITGAVRGTSGGAVSTNILSLVCSRSYDEMLRRGRSAIDQELIGEIVANNLFEKYYLEATDGLPSEARRFIEDHLVDSADRRNSVSETDFFKAIPDGEMLIEDGPRKILQRVSVASDTGQTRIELVHDSFCEPIARFRRKRQQKRRNYVAAGAILAALLIFGISTLIIHSMKQREWKMLENQSRFVAETAIRLAEEGDYLMAKRLAAAALPANLAHPKDRPYVPRAEYALWKAWEGMGGVIRIPEEMLYCSVAFSPDGKSIVSAANLKIYIWDSFTGESIVPPMEGHTGPIKSVAYSPDGDYIVSASLDSTIRIWDGKTGTPLGKPIDKHRDFVHSVSFSPDGRYFASASSDSTVCIWDVETREMVGEPMRGHTDKVFAALYSPDGSRIASGSNDGTIKIWDSETRKCVLTIQLPSPSPAISLRIDKTGVSSLVYSPDGKSIAGATYDGDLCIWDGESGEIITTIQRDTWTTITSLVFSPDGKRLISGVADGSMVIWDSKTGKQVGKPFEGHLNTIRSLAFSPDGRRLASSSIDTTLRLWDYEPDYGFRVWRSNIKSVSALSLSPDGKLIAVGGYEGVHILDCETGDMVGKTQNESSDEYIIECVTFSPDGAVIAAGGTDNKIRFWSAKTGESVGCPLEGHTDYVFSLAFSPDGKHLVSGAQDKTIRVWDIETGGLVYSLLEGHDYPIHSVVYSPDGRLIISGSTDGTVRVWESKTGEQVGDPIICQNYIKYLAFFPDGRRILVGSDSGSFQIWDLVSREPLSGLTGYQGLNYHSCVSLSPDGKKVAFSSGKAPVIWDIEKGEIICELPEKTTWLYPFVFTPDGEHIILSKYNEVSKYDLSLEHILEKTRGTYPPLTTEERGQYYLE